LKDFDEGDTKAFEFGVGEAAGLPARTNAGTEERFVGVDVTHAGEQGLIEESGLDGEAPAAKERSECVGADGERFGAGSVEGFSPRQITEFEAAEAAGIDEAQFAAAGEGEARVGVGFEEGVGSGDEKTAGHAEVDDPFD